MALQSITISGTGGPYYPVALTAEVKAALRAAGYNPDEYNRLKFTIGASNYTRGCFLVTQTTIDALAAAPLPANLAITMGDEVSPVTFVGLQLHPLPPQPLYISGLGAGSGTTGKVRLYALTLVDDRYYFTAPSETSFNVKGPGAVGFEVNSVVGGTTRYTYAQAITSLLGTLGLSGITRDTPANISKPYDVDAEGENSANWLDRVLIECGQVFVPTYTGSYVIEQVNKRTFVDVLDTVKDHIETGCAEWMTNGSVPSGIVGDATPIALWRKNGIPETVTVSFPRWYDATQSYQRRATVTTATVTAASESLDAKSGYIYNLNDNTPARVSNSSDLLTRANDLATAFYRRFKAGAGEAMLLGIRQVVMGGSCQEVEFICDSEFGFRTHVRTSTTHPLLGMADGAPRPATGGGGMLVQGNTWGGVTIQDWGRVALASIVSSSGTTPGVPGTITYTVRIAGNQISNNVNAGAPLIEFIDAGGRVNAATGNCLVLINETDSNGNCTSCQMLIANEAIATVACPSGSSFGPVTALVIINNVLTDGENVLFDGDGNALVGGESGTFANVWDCILSTGTDWLFGIDGNLLVDVTGDQTLGAADGVLMSNTGSPLIGNDGSVLYTWPVLPS